MINTAVHDTVILPLVLLGIHYPGHITAAGRGQEAACFQGDASLERHGVKGFPEICQHGILVHRGFPLKVRYMETRSIFQFTDFVLQFVPYPFQKGVQLFQFLSNLAGLLFLGS